MKSRPILVYIFCLLLASLFPKIVYGNESSQTIGDDNNCPTQIINSERINITCNVMPQTNNDASSANQRSSASEETIEKYSSNPGGYTPLQNSSPQISNSGGYTSTQIPEPQISNSDGLVPTQIPQPQISTY